MARKNLSDAIHGDRASIRGYVQKVFGDDDFTVPKTSTYPSGKGDKLSGYLTHQGTHSGGKNYSPCYESHKALKLPGSELVIYGGSCGTPFVKDADVYIGFDRHTMRTSQRSWPWKKGTEFCFPIADMCAPTDAEEFIKLVDWTVKQLKDGLKVHAGCIGGHGRTGTFLSAVVSRFGEQDACTYVRKNYCSKAVESSSQMKFLNKHFGVKIISGSKEGSVGMYKGSSSTTGFSSGKVETVKASGTRFPCLSNHGSVWEKNPNFEWAQE